MPVAAGAAMLSPINKTPISVPIAMLVKSRHGAQISNFCKSGGKPT
jgi:hypothetical protein